jgi:hypothetical protein
MTARSCFTLLSADDRFRALGGFAAPHVSVARDRQAHFSEPVADAKLAAAGCRAAVIQQAMT